MMQRRRFLQLAAGATAGVAMQHASRLSSLANQYFLRLAPFTVEPVPGVVVPSTMIAFDRNYAVTRSAVEAHSLAVNPSARRDGQLNDFAPAPHQLIEMLVENAAGSGHGSLRWIIDGRPYLNHDPLSLPARKRYRLRMMNATQRAHSVHMQGNRFEITRVKQAAVAGLVTAAVCLDPYSVVDADILVGDGQSWRS